MNFSLGSSQQLKEINIQDSITLKYPLREDASKKAGEIFFESKISANALRNTILKKLEGRDISSITDDNMRHLVNYYRTHFLWIFIDSNLKNFTDEEIRKISDEIKIRKSKDLVLQKFRSVEIQSIIKFGKEF